MVIADISVTDSDSDSSLIDITNTTYRDVASKIQDAFQPTSDDECNPPPRSHEPNFTLSVLNPPNLEHKSLSDEVLHEATSIATLIEAKNKYKPLRAQRSYFIPLYNVNCNSSSTKKSV